MIMTAWTFLRHPLVQITNQLYAIVCHDQLKHVIVITDWTFVMAEPIVSGLQGYRVMVRCQRWIPGSCPTCNKQRLLL